MPSTDDSTYLINLWTSKNLRYNFIVTSNSIGERPDVSLQTDYCTGPKGSSFFAIDKDSLWIKTGFIREPNNTVRSFQCTQQTCWTTLVNEKYNPSLVKSGSEFLARRLKRQAESQPRTELQQKNGLQKFAVGVEIVVDWDALQFFCSQNPDKSNCCDNLPTGSTFPKACEALYDYFTLYIGFVARIFSNAANPDLEIGIYLTDVVIGFNRTNGKPTSLLTDYLNRRDYLWLGVAHNNKVMDFVRANRSSNNSSAATMLVTNYTGRGADGIAVMSSVCSSDALGIVSEWFDYSTLGTFTHELAHMLGAEHSQGGLLHESYDGNGSDNYYIKCVTLKQMYAYLVYGFISDNEVRYMTKSKVPRCVNMNHPSNANYHRLSRVSIVPVETTSSQ